MTFTSRNGPPKNHDLLFINSLENHEQHPSLTCETSLNSKCSPNHSSHVVKFGFENDEFFVFISPENIDKLVNGKIDEIDESLLFLSLKELMDEDF